jgi:hypothetical protein
MLALPQRSPWRDRIVLLAAATAAFFVAAFFDLHERFEGWAAQYERYNADELVTLAAGAAVVALGYLAVTRRRLGREVTVRQEREAALRKAMHEIDVLSGLLSMCASCKRVRNDNVWEPIEVYLKRHGEISFSHGLCPDCATHLYPDFVDSEPNAA